MTRHRDNFEAIRLLAATTVLYGHAHALTGTVSPAVMGSAVQALAVKVFFVVSGFLVSLSWHRDSSFPRYIQRRALRIFPGLIVVILLTIFLVGPVMTALPLKEYWPSKDTWAYLSNIALNPSYMLPGLFAHNIYPIAVNGSLWSLPVEFVMYLVLPAIALTGKRTPHRLVVCAVILCAASLYFIRAGVGPQRLVFYGTNWISGLDVAPYFLLGALWQLVIPRKMLNPQVAILMLALFPFVPTNPIIQETTLFVVLPYIVLSFANAQPAVFGWLGRFGDFSYGIYIYGFLVEQIISNLAKTDGHPLWNFSFSLIPTVLLAAASWHFIEKPFLRYKPRVIASSASYAA